MREFQEKIDFIKRQFRSADSNSNCEASFCLLKTLYENDDKFMEEFLESNVMINILEAMNSLNQKYILESLELIIRRGLAIKNYFIDKTLTFVKISDLINSKEEATVTLNIFFTLLSQELELNKKNGILLIEKHAAKLLNFLNQTTFELSSLLTAAKLFNFVIKYSDLNFQQTYFSLIEKIYFQVMDYLLKFKDDSYFERIRTACCVSFSIANVCCKIDVIEEQVEKKIFNIIKQTAMKNVVPMLHSAEINITSAEDFIDFLELSISSKFYDNFQLCFKLVENNYLKYFLNLSIFDSEKLDFRKKVCRLMSKIIVSLENFFQFSLNDWENGSLTFQNYLSFGFEQLPRDLKKWEENLKIPNEKSNSLLVLFYCHFLVTEEKYIFTKTAINLHLMNLDVSCTKRIFLKVLLLLYAVSPVTGIFSEFSQSTKTLTTIFEKFENIDYTHHKSFFLFTMKNILISDEMRVQIIRLWIDQSKSVEEFNLFIEQCLDQGYNDLKIVKILMDVIHGNSMKNIDNAGKVFAALLEFGRKMPIEVVEYVLNILTQDLINYTSDNSKILEVVIMIAGNLSLNLSLSAQIVNKCAKSLIDVTVKKEINLNLKKLLLSMSVFIMQQSLDATNFKAAKTFLKNNDFLKLVLNDSFNSSNSTIIQCETMAEVKLKDLKNIYEKTKQKNQSQFYFVTFIKQLLLNNQLESPLIQLYKKNDVLHLKNIFYIYHMIHDISYKTDVDGQKKIYECLSTILYYCFFQKINLSPFLKCPATFFVFKRAINRISNLLEANYNFQDFAITWLRHIQWARRNEQLILNSDIKQSIALLSELRSILLNIKRKDSLIEDFCSVVDNYLTLYDY
ncbi:uncharacterized protein LOC127283947 isoform X2 [Leptopilina boulardi]|uniref:uncharacterized protein LOC127283947 isoform X2 n=1 Tax=Leptopilina boulardi TaxID=63433 RepID=UPI0021F552BB|nr:uncharacterized protein LOC127283947 isoform X2 [Leptopilina boulardi]